jgi:hypothetical protein
MSQPEHGWLVLLFSLFVAVGSVSCGGTTTSDNEDPKAHETVLARIQTTQTAIVRLTPTATPTAPEPTAWPLGTLESLVTGCSSDTPEFLGHTESSCRCLAEGLEQAGITVAEMRMLDAVAFRPGPSGFHPEMLLNYMLSSTDPFVELLYEGDPATMSSALDVARVCRGRF